MGEAKRRKKLDPSYGKIPLLRTEHQQKHVNQIIDDLYSQHGIIMQMLSHEKFPDFYDQICVELTEWLENRLSKYREQEREIIATYLLQYFCVAHEKYEISPVTFFCFSGILKSYFSSELRENMELYIEKVSSQFESEPEHKRIS